MYVPVYYVLLQNKKESTYRYALQACISASEGRMLATTYTSDFEQAILSTMKTEFPTGVAVGCLFHWKQAIRRKLVDFHIPKYLISELIGTNGVVNILTGIPIEEIIPKGIPYCRRGFDESSHQEQFNAFWEYFVKIWMIRYNPRIWNMHSFISESADFTLVNRTNNPLERFNNKMNEAIPTPHAPMSRIVETIRAISEEYVTDLGRIQKGTMAKPVHLPVTMYEIPESYTTFQP
jgi:MULE transposase domain